ncbi:MAG TPA: hypothetical protein ACFCUC_17505 [Desulfobacterales bacterium]
MPEVFVPAGEVERDLRHPLFGRRRGHPQNPLNDPGNAMLFVRQMEPGNHPRGVAEDLDRFSSNIQFLPLGSAHIKLSSLSIRVF